MADSYGIIASFLDTSSFYHAAEKVRDAGYKKWDTYSSFPVHGMPEAQGKAAQRYRFYFLGWYYWIYCRYLTCLVYELF